MGDDGDPPDSSQASPPRRRRRTYGSGVADPAEGAQGGWSFDVTDPPSETDVSANTIRLERPFVPATGSRRVSLIVIRGKDVGYEFPLDEAECVLGRDPTSDFTVEDEMASRRHSSVRVVGSSAAAVRHVVRDLDSTNGTLVNNRKVSEVELRDGDRIILGETILLYRVLDEIDISYQDEIRKLIRYHDLTGFLTLKEFYKIVRRGMRGSKPPHFAVLMVDVDNLREINGLYGHLAGSAVVRRIGEVFRGELASDQAVGIYGGDEFICYVPEASLEKGLELAERLRRAVESDELTYEGTRLPFTVCVGVSHHPSHGTRIQDLVRAADVALYRAKALGKNRTVVFEE